MVVLVSMADAARPLLGEVRAAYPRCSRPRTPCGGPGVVAERDLAGGSERFVLVRFTHAGP